MAIKLMGTWQQEDKYLEQVQDRAQDRTKA